VPRWRRALAATLVVVGCLLAPLAVHSVWLHDTLLNTDQYVATVGPLAGNAHVQDALADRITTTLVNAATLETRLKDALPPSASFVVPFVANGIRSYVHSAALHVLQSPTFQQLWKSLNRQVHLHLVDVLRGQGRFVNNLGQVVVDIQPVITEVDGVLTKAGITGLSAAAGQDSHQIVLFRSSVLAQAQRAVRLLDDVALVLPILTVVAFAGAIVASGDRRRTIVWGGMGLAFVMLLFLVIWNALRSPYQDALPASVNRLAAGAVYDQLLSFLLLALRTVFAVGVTVALGAWLAGPGRCATRVRTGARDLVFRAPGQDAISPRAARLVGAHRSVARFAVIGFGLLVLVVLNHPGPGAVVVIAILVLVLLAVTELLARAGQGDSTGQRP